LDGDLLLGTDFMILGVIIHGTDITALTDIIALITATIPIMVIILITDIILTMEATAEMVTTRITEVLIIREAAVMVHLEIHQKVQV